MDNIREFPMLSAESPTPPAPTPDAVDITGEAFARRLGKLLTHRRTNSKLSVGAMTRRSDEHFTRRQLRQFEAGEVRLDIATASALASLYEVDLESIMPTRTDVRIDERGVISAGGVEAAFTPGDPDSLLATYLRLVRRLRDQQHVAAIALRREDIEGLATYLEQPCDTVVDRLGTLMGATKVQRRMMALLFLAGAMVITVAVPTVAAFASEDAAPVGPGAYESGNSVAHHDEIADSSDGVGTGGPDPVEDEPGPGDPRDLEEAAGDQIANRPAGSDMRSDRAGPAAVTGGSSDGSTSGPAGEWSGEWSDRSTTESSGGPSGSSGASSGSTIESSGGPSGSTIESSGGSSGSSGGSERAPSAPVGSTLEPDEVAVGAPPVPATTVPIVDTPIVDTPIVDPPIVDTPIGGEPSDDLSIPEAPIVDPGTPPPTDDDSTPDEISVIDPPIPATPDPVGPDPGPPDTDPVADPADPPVPDDQQPDDQQPDDQQPDPDGAP